MKDEEYISELCLVAIEGIQNKKDRIEDFYQEAEMNFTHGAYLTETFDRVLGFLQPMTPELCHTRWKNKTDFYTLFFALCKKQNCLPKDEGIRDNVRNALVDFSVNVNEFLGLETENTDAYPQYIKDYAKGVRAATDSSARTVRQNALDEYLNIYIVDTQV